MRISSKKDYKIKYIYIDRYGKKSLAGTITDSGFRNLTEMAHAFNGRYGIIEMWVLCIDDDTYEQYKIVGNKFIKI